jgi:hypothetical protein
MAFQFPLIRELDKPWLKREWNQESSFITRASWFFEVAGVDLRTTDKLHVYTKPPWWIMASKIVIFSAKTETLKQLMQFQIWD